MQNKQLLLILVMCIATGCGAKPNVVNVPEYDRRAQLLANFPMDGKPHNRIYVAGWQDGCRSGVAASSRREYRLNKNFVQNWDLIGDQFYYKGWNAAFDYCRHYQREIYLKTIGML